MVRKQLFLLVDSTLDSSPAPDEATGSIWVVERDKLGALVILQFSQSCSGPKPGGSSLSELWSFLQDSPARQSRAVSSQRGGGEHPCVHSHWDIICCCRSTSQWFCGSGWPGWCVKHRFPHCTQGGCAETHPWISHGASPHSPHPWQSLAKEHRQP